MKINEQLIHSSTLRLIALFVIVPIFFYATAEAPRRSFLKEAISIITVVSLCLMLAQFFITRTNRWLLGDHSIRKTITNHKIIGYFFLSILLIHPVLIVVPRYFEAGVGSLDAFITIITTLHSPGIVLGMCAWFLGVILGVTSLIRKKLPLTYTRWRFLHGILAILFTVLGSWHALYLGRHMTSTLSYYVVLFTVTGILSLLATYIFQSLAAQRVTNEQ